MAVQLGALGGELGLGYLCADGKAFSTHIGSRRRLALTAARLSLDTRLPMADSVVLATARLDQATLWTQDADFASLPGVRYRSRKT